MYHIDESDPIGELEPSFPYRDVEIKRNVEIKDFYDLEEEIGRGKFGIVYKCREKCSGLKLAAKFVAVSRREDRRNVEREIEIMRELQHPRLIQLYDAFDSGKVMCVILELIEGGELFERVIDNDFVLTEKSCTVFMRQICEGIQFIHSKNILHLDMKPENILCLTKTGNRIKIIDFGLARKYDPSKKLQVLFGTPEFVAPEVVNFDQIGFATDMWSVGVICYVLLSGLSPFMGETDIETMANVTIAKYDFDDEVFDEISSEAKDFIAKLLVKDKEKRMTATQSLAHPWFKRQDTKPNQKDVQPKTIKPVDANEKLCVICDGDKVEPKKNKESPLDSKDIAERLTPTRHTLDVAKDHLRQFVERWSEHPNSPYSFDNTSHLIIPSDDKPHGSLNSLVCVSPSPCGSVQSLSDDTDIFIDTKDKTDDENKYNTINSGYISNFVEKRRASDSDSVIKRSDKCEKINLAAEIKKLSEKLFQLASLPVDLTNRDNCQDSSQDLKITPDVEESTHTEITAQQKRTKFKITGINRDVPMIFQPGKSKDGKSSATGTKNLLLHLLDRWDGKEHKECAQSGNGANSLFDFNGFRHKSISEWTETEVLGQKSISSLNKFFQSRQPNKKFNPDGKDEV